MPRQILIVAAVFLAALFGLRAIGVPMSGPIAVVLACIAAVLSLRSTGEDWPSLGLVRSSLPRTLLTALGGAVLGYLTAAVAVVVTTQVLGWPPMQSGRLGAIQDNLPLLLGMLAIAWSTAALGEELLFRGFLQGRLQAMWGGGQRAGLLAVLVQSLAFGLAHAYRE
ncbi:CPBP family intramembrane glutamic endopeptidase [Arenimonas daejeonensis]|uniref:CPBP family intramembrane glutamic endopeptidase n=1 Tax=Arenimonas daejeonensis TaxID=370777 RepID=UPI0015805445|nr:CPBP family intramembrane glutamic endopeptidase [Arenimonas daejeonensis]